MTLLWLRWCRHSDPRTRVVNIALRRVVTWLCASISNNTKTLMQHTLFGPFLTLAKEILSFEGKMQEEANVVYIIPHSPPLLRNCAREQRKRHHSKVSSTEYIGCGPQAIIFAGPHLGQALGLFCVNLLVVVAHVTDQSLDLALRKTQHL